MSPGASDATSTRRKANIAVIGAGWWSQGWHIPQLSRNKDRCNLVAIVDSSPHPHSTLNPDLESLEDLGAKYSCPVYSSIDGLLADGAVSAAMDGVIICTPHSTHHDIGVQFLEYGTKRANSGGGKPLHILMEKPMTTCVEEAKSLHELVSEYEKRGDGSFLINHSANYREQSKSAKDMVMSGKLGRIRLITATFSSPLTWLFDSPANKGWNEPDGKMLGNGFGWGQASHMLAWIYHVSNVTPSRVYCQMTHSTATGADVSHSATITCADGTVFSLSGTSLLPGYEHSKPPLGKRVGIEMFGTEGTLIYGGDDQNPTSGYLELRTANASNSGQVRDLGFHFENTETSGLGPESLMEFVTVCKGGRPYAGANSAVGLKAVQTIEAMYRSNASGKAEDIL
eukprot:CAMPEP_0181026852 /NCGR_PEP_ID=MMETSP1070-20121207/3861_1 /TAXON_ID=265543 /ORGANISM="Minutocellus polymorphus, Strain NH13" /LENGTH=397 /DNA_ID=CAMNT_0023104073 /DNA_START=335 /DNA_END=1528 /DNA_ORIENTATION=-